MAELVRFPIRLQSKDRVKQILTDKAGECEHPDTSQGSEEYRYATNTFTDGPQFISLKPYNSSDYLFKNGDTTKGYNAYLHGFYNSLYTSLYDENGDLIISGQTPEEAIAADDMTSGLGRSALRLSPHHKTLPPSLKGGGGLSKTKDKNNDIFLNYFKDTPFFKKDNQWDKRYVNITPAEKDRKPFTDFIADGGVKCLCPNNQELYTTINVRGNGNCGFYSYMLGVYYLAATTGMTVDDQLWKAISTEGIYPTSSAEDVPNFGTGSGPEVQGELGVVFPNEAVEAFKLLVIEKLSDSSITINAYQRDSALEILGVQNSSDGGVSAAGHINYDIYAILFHLFNIPVFIWKQGKWEGMYDSTAYIVQGKIHTIDQNNQKVSVKLDGSASDGGGGGDTVTNIHLAAIRKKKESECNATSWDSLDKPTINNLNINDKVCLRYKKAFSHGKWIPCHIDLNKQFAAASNAHSRIYEVDRTKNLPILLSGGAGHYNLTLPIIISTKNLTNCVIDCAKMPNQAKYEEEDAIATEMLSHGEKATGVKNVGEYNKKYSTPQDKSAAQAATTTTATAAAQETEPSVSQNDPNDNKIKIMEALKTQELSPEYLEHKTQNNCIKLLTILDSTSASSGGQQQLFSNVAIRSFKGMLLDEWRRSNPLISRLDAHFSIAASDVENSGINESFIQMVKGLGNTIIYNSFGISRPSSKTIIQRIKEIQQIFPSLTNKEITLYLNLIYTLHDLSSIDKELFANLFYDCFGIQVYDFTCDGTPKFILLSDSGNTTLYPPILLYYKNDSDKQVYNIIPSSLATKVYKASRDYETVAGEAAAASTAAAAKQDEVKKAAALAAEVAKSADVEKETAAEKKDVVASAANASAARSDGTDGAGGTTHPKQQPREEFMTELLQLSRPTTDEGNKIYAEIQANLKNLFELLKGTPGQQGQQQQQQQQQEEKEEVKEEEVVVVEEKEDAKAAAAAATTTTAAQATA